MNLENLKSKFNQLTLESEDHWDYRGNNKSERDYVHGFCTYPAMMVPKMQREILQVCLSQSENKHLKLLDPFAGSGTILVEGMLQGLDIVGIDINPLAVLLCKVKTTIIDPQILKQYTNDIVHNICRLKRSKIEKHFFDGIEKWFTPQAIMDLTILRNAIIKYDDINIRRFFWATFCEVIRVVSNSRDCTYKLHIKEKSDIDGYDKDAIDLFLKTLSFNVDKYLTFYNKLKNTGKLKKDGLSYKGKIEIILGDSIAYLNHTKQKFDLVLTSPPYGDNHTTVSYGQYSIMPLRWIQCFDIDDAFDKRMLSTLTGIDNLSLGGKSANITMTQKRKQVLKKSETLEKQCEEIKKIADKQVNKLIAFYSDYDLFLSAISKKMKLNAISVWTLGNRKIAKQEIHMDNIMIELCSHYKLSLVTSFTRKILNKRMPEISAYNGEGKESQPTMTREHILIFNKDL